MRASKVAAAPALARVPVGPTDEIRDAVWRRSISLYARLRLAEAIRAVALDICGDIDDLAPNERAWLRQALATPVNEATEESLRVLVQELSSALRAAPGRLRPAIVAAPLVSRTDFE